MNSFNHYAYGAIGDWMYRVAAGIDTKDAGYRHLILEPHPAKNLSFAKASFDSQYGRIVSGWERKDNMIIMHFTIPANSDALIILPVDNGAKVTQNGSPVKDDGTIESITREEKKMISIKKGSGEYTFEYRE